MGTDRPAIVGPPLKVASARKSMRTLLAPTWQKTWRPGSFPDGIHVQFAIVTQRPLSHQPAEPKEIDMPKLTVDGAGTFDVPQGKRLVLALTDEAGIDQLHACGGN